MVTVPHKMVGLERMLDYKGVALARFHCTCTLYLLEYLCGHKDVQASHFHVGYLQYYRVNIWIEDHTQKR